MCLCPHCLPFARGPFLIVLPEILCFNLPCYVFLLQIVFSPALSREFRPYKPDPAPLLHICSTWDVQPNEVLMVGDSLKDDVSDILPKFFFDTLCCFWCLYQKDGSLLLRLKGWCDTIILSCVGELCDQCLSNGWLIYGLYRWPVESELEPSHACLMKKGGTVLLILPSWIWNQTSRSLP